MEFLFNSDQIKKTELFRVKPINTIGLYGPQEKRNFENHETALIGLIMELKVHPNPSVKK